MMIIISVIMSEKLMNKQKAISTIIKVLNPNHHCYLVTSSKSVFGTPSVTNLAH